MLIVAPSGSTKEDTSLDAPMFSTHSILIGSVPTDEELENAKRDMQKYSDYRTYLSLKNFNGLIPPIVFTANEYTTTAWMM